MSIFCIYYLLIIHIKFSVGTGSLPSAVAHPPDIPAGGVWKELQMLGLVAKKKLGGELWHWKWDMRVKLFPLLAMETTKGNNHKLQLGELGLDTEWEVSISRGGSRGIGCSECFGLKRQVTAKEGRSPLWSGKCKHPPSELLGFWN